MIGTYEYDLWGRIENISESEEGIDTDGILTKNPIRYRGYYYDNETGFFNLNARYYDPQIRRFISADSMNLLMVATTSVNCKNLFNYSENNPVTNKDGSGAVVETVFDVVTLAGSVVDVCCNPTNPWAWAGLVGDAVDLIPVVTGVGEGIKGARAVAKAADKVDDVADAAVDVAKAVKKGGSDLDIPSATPSINQGKDPFRNANFKKPDIKMVNDAANQVGIDRKEFGNYIHEIKADFGMKANQNFTYQELLELAEEYKKMTR